MNIIFAAYEAYEQSVTQGAEDNGLAKPQTSLPARPDVKLSGDDDELMFGDLKISHHGSKYFKLESGQKLIAVFTYLKGSRYVADLIRKYRTEIIRLRNQLAECSRQNRVA